MAASILAFSCDEPQKGQSKPSIEINTTTLTFDASPTETQTVSIKAIGVEWIPEVAATAAEWICAEKTDDGTLSVSVTPNTTAEQRIGAISVKPADNADIRPKEVSVIQNGSDNIIEYDMTVEPKTLTFAAESAEPQNVVVTTVGEGLTWRAEPAEDWIKIDENDNGLTVTVTDNPEEKQRTSYISVKADKETVEENIVRITQEARVIPPSFSLEFSDGITLEDGCTFDYIGRNQFKITVHAVNVTWEARIEYSTDESKWLTMYITEDEHPEIRHLSLSSNIMNESADPRTAKIIIKTNLEGCGPYEINVVQEGKPDMLSKLTEDVDFGRLTHSSEVAVYANNEYRKSTATTWEMKFWSDGIEEYMGYKFTGTGDRLEIKIATEAVDANTDNNYSLPEGIYEVTANFNDLLPEEPHPQTICGGAFSYSHPNFTNGAWYLRMENDAVPGDACITGGTMTVSKSGDEYEMTFEFTSDAQYTVRGSYKGVLKFKTVS